MVMLIKNSIGLKAKIQMRMLGAVIVLYIMLVISGVFITNTRKTTLDNVDDAIALLQPNITF